MSRRHSTDRFLISVALLASLLASSVAGADELTDAEAKAVARKTLEAVHGDLVKIKDAFPQLKGIEGAGPDGDQVVFSRGYAEEHKGKSVLRKDGCSLFLRIEYRADRGPEWQLENATFRLSNGKYLRLWRNVVAEKTEQGAELKRKVNAIFSRHLASMFRELRCETVPLGAKPETARAEADKGVQCTIDFSPAKTPGQALFDVALKLHNKSREPIVLPYTPAAVVEFDEQFIFLGPGTSVHIKDAQGQQIPTPPWILTFRRGIAPLGTVTVPPSESWELKAEGFHLRGMKPGSYTISFEHRPFTKPGGKFWAGKIASPPVRVEI